MLNLGGVFNETSGNELSQIMLRQINSESTSKKSFDISDVASKIVNFLKMHLQVILNFSLKGPTFNFQRPCGYYFRDIWLFENSQ